MKKLIPLILIMCLLLSGCGTKKVTETVFAMDTVMSLSVYGREEQAREALDESKFRILELEGQLSVTNEESALARVNAQGWGTLPGDAGELVRTALQLAEETGGAYDPTVKPIMDAWGFYDDEFEKVVPESSYFQEILHKVNYAWVTLGDFADEKGTAKSKVNFEMAGMGLDLGGIAKGYAAEEVLRIMGEKDIEAAVISLGGNVGLMGQKPDGSDWTVAVEKPDGSGATVATMTIPGGEKNTYVVTSGAYQRYFEVDGVRYHHILDPETGMPAETDLLSVTVISENGTEADALSTALFVMGFDEAVAYWQSHRDDFSVVLITEKGLFVSQGISIVSELPTTTLEVAE